MITSAFTIWMHFTTRFIFCKIVICNKITYNILYLQKITLVDIMDSQITQKLSQSYAATDSTNTGEDATQSTITKHVVLAAQSNSPQDW